MQRLYLRVLAVVVGLALALGLAALAFAEGGGRYQLVVLGQGDNERTFALEVATDETSRRGLRGRSSLARDGGLLVRLAKPAVLAYSTRYTNFPLDVLFLDEYQNITSIVSLQPNDDRLTAASSATPVSGALLLYGGTARRQGLYVGTHIDLGHPPHQRDDATD